MLQFRMAAAADNLLDLEIIFATENRAKNFSLSEKFPKNSLKWGAIKSKVASNAWIGVII